ncbi:BrnT family toxin [Patescibacteria group bacterium]|nr:BrnT family toxin [Patescibacteria group bacterium]
MRLPKILAFEWDGGNLDKSYEKHGISPKETEEVFVSEELFVLPDNKHSQTEKRHIALGKTQEGKRLFVIFTLRGKKVRIVSARKMHKKEVEKYEKAKKST